MSIDISSIKPIIDRFFILIESKHIKRNELHEKEFVESMESMQDINTEIVSSITEMIHYFEKLERSISVIRTNDWPKKRKEIFGIIRDKQSDFNERRHQTKALRKKVFARASGRNFDYFDVSARAIVDDDERLLFRDFFESILQYFRDANGNYHHQLKHSVMNFSLTISILEGKRTRKSYIQEIDGLIEQLETSRRNCYDKWEIVARRYYEVERALKFR